MCGNTGVKSNLNLFIYYNLPGTNERIQRRAEGLVKAGFYERKLNGGRIFGRHCISPRTIVSSICYVQSSTLATFHATSDIK